MRKVLIFFSLVIFAVIFTALSAFIMYNYDEVQERQDFGFGDVTVSDGEAVLEVYFYPENAKHYSKYDTIVKDNILYVWVYASYKDKNIAEANESGYIYITIPIEDNITEIRHVTKDDNFSIWKKELTY